MVGECAQRVISRITLPAVLSCGDACAAGDAHVRVTPWDIPAWRRDLRRCVVTRVAAPGGAKPLRGVSPRERAPCDTPGACRSPAELQGCHSSTSVENVVDNFLWRVEDRAFRNSGARCAPVVHTVAGRPRPPGAGAVDGRGGV